MNKTKRKIFETSMKLFAEKGYEATSIEEITATVGVAKGTLYYHFGSKEEIFNCVRLDDEFHRFLISPLNNKYAEEMMDSFFDYLTMIRITVTSDAVRYAQSNTEHVEVIDAILQGDREKACQKLQEHLDTAYRVTIRNFGRQELPEPFSG